MLGSLLKVGLGLWQASEKRSAAKAAQQEALRTKEQAEALAKARELEARWDKYFIDREILLNDEITKIQVERNKEQGLRTISDQIAQASAMGIDVFGSSVTRVFIETANEFEDREFDIRFTNEFTNETLTHRGEQAIRQGKLNADEIRAGGAVRAFGYQAQAKSLNIGATSTLIGTGINALNALEEWRDASPKGLLG